MIIQQGQAKILIKVERSIKEFIQILLSKQDGLWHHFIRNSVATFTIKIASIGFGFLANLILARVLGVSGYGIYSYTMSIILLLIIPATLGIPQLLIRNIASYHVQSSWSLMRGLLRWANVTVIATSISLALLCVVITWLFRPQAITTFWIALLILPLMALSQIRQATLQGLNRIIEGQIPEMLIQPVSFILLMSIVYIFLRQDINPTLAISIQAMAVGFAFLIGSIMARRRLPTFVKNFSPSYIVRAWMRSSFSILFLQIMSFVVQDANILILGALKEAQDVGIYKGVTQLSSLLPIVFYAFLITTAPTFSALYTRGDMERLQHIVTIVARLGALSSLPLVLAFLMCGKWFLLIFGQGFSEGTTALAILTIGQFINVATGPVGVVLIMTGHEYDYAKGIAIAALVNIILSMLLIPPWGIEGAAVSNTVSMITWNVLLSVLVYRRLNIHSTILGSIKFRRG